MTALGRKLLALGWGLLIAGLGCAQPAVIVHKCIDHQGKTSFQQKPCAPEDATKVLRVEGDIDPAVAQAARERAAADAPAPREPATQTAVANAPEPVSRPERPPPCPATRENPGRITVVGTDPWSMAVARSIYNDLPSETTLKNSGRWPRDCVR